MSKDIKRPHSSGVHYSSRQLSNLVNDQNVGLVNSYPQISSKAANESPTKTILDDTPVVPAMAFSDNNRIDASTEKPTVETNTKEN